MNKLTNNSAKSSAITTVLFNKGMSPKEAMVVAAALIINQSEMQYGLDIWLDAMDDAIFNTEMEIAGEVKTGMRVNNWLAMAQSCDLVNDDGTAGEYLLKLDEVKPKAYPMPASATRIARNRKIIKSGAKCTPLLKKAVGALQKTEVTIDTYMHEVAMQVFPVGKPCDERYILEGCAKLIADGNVPCTSEFKADDRARLNQADCHGSNGQSSDMARALQDLSGVAQDYDIDKAITLMNHELADMMSVTYEEAVNGWKAAGSASEFIKQCISGEFEGVKKPWSVVKAVKTLVALKKGQKPYIGMAFGLDAKCSGPQLGALMTGDQKIAAACGFSDVVVADAYAHGSANLVKNFGTVGRNTVKKPFMGVFYGEGKMAYSDVANFNTPTSNSKKLKTNELLNVVMRNGDDMEENGELFHKAIESSFGEMSTLRKAIRKAHYHFEDTDYGMQMVMNTTKPTSYFMSDGLEVKMDYTNKVDIHGDAVKFDSEPDTVSIKLGLHELKFNAITFKTKVVALYDHARTGFVNLIQATDALLARLIVSHLEDLGAQHIVSVHDCFRVNINDMIDGKLHQAIKLAYMDLFGSTENVKTKMLPMGTDIINLYFKGVSEAGANLTSLPSQFATSARTGKVVRKLKHINGQKLPALINNLRNELDNTGTSYYFAK